MTAWNQALGGAVRLRYTQPDTASLTGVIQALVSDRVASRIAAVDPTLWGSQAEEEAAKRLDWVSLPTESRHLVPEIAALRAELVERGLNRVVLCGMGGSSLAPEVICAAAGVPLVVLDSSNPDMVRAATADDLAETIVVVSSKSGGTVETDSLKRTFEAAFRDAGIDPVDRIVVVTDPGSPLDEEATAAGYRVFRADPEVGGRYSALTAFGLVPSGLAGADIGQLLDEAEAALPTLGADDPGNPALCLGGLLGCAASNGVDKLVLADAGGPYAGLGDWIEQLVAESTGKHGRGLLPVVVDSTKAPNFTPSTADSVLVAYGSGHSFDDAPPESGYAVSIEAPLGAQMQLWETATAVAGRILGINPFDQPDVESAKQAAREMLDGADGVPLPRWSDGPFEIHAGDWLPSEVDTAREAVRVLLDQVDGARGYLAVHAYLDRHSEAGLAEVRDALALRTGRPVTFGWGPRFLHSTGQYHKGGPATGVYLQVTADPSADLQVPGREFSFQEFLIAQAVGDAQVLSGKGRPVLRVHIRDLGAGLSQLEEMLR